MITALINSKSNYRNLNGSWLPVQEMRGLRVTCLGEIDGKQVKIDFTLSEIIGFIYDQNDKQC
jgi:hypothetical protein